MYLINPKMNIFVFCSIYLLIIPALFSQSITNTSVLTFGEIPCKTIAINPKNDLIATGVGQDIYLWDASSAKIIKTLKGHNGTVTSLVFSNKNDNLISGAEDNTAILWDIKTGEKIRTFVGHEKRVSSVAISADDKYILTGSYDWNAKLWDTQTGANVQTYKGHKHWIYSVAFSPDGKMVLTGSSDFTAKLWNRENGTLAGSLLGHTNNITTLKFTPNQKYILTGSTDESVFIWNAENGEFVRKLTPNVGQIYELDISKDGKYFVVGGSNKKASIWNLKKMEKWMDFKEHKAAVIACKFSNTKKSQTIISASHDKSVLKWDLGFGSVKEQYFEKSYPITKGVFSKKGDKAIAALSNGTIKIWSTSTGRTDFLLKADKKIITALAVSLDGKFFITAGNGKTLKLWDLELGKMVRSYEGLKTTVADIAFIDENKFLTVGEKFIQIWDVSQDKPIKTSKQKANLYTLAIAAGSNTIFTNGKSNEIQTFDLQSLSPTGNLEGHAHIVTDLAVSDNGQFLVSGSNDRTAKIWNIEERKLIKSFPGHLGVITTVDISSKGNFILTGSQDKTVRIWDVQTNLPIEMIEGHTKTITTATFSEDDQFVYTTSSDKTAKLWLAGYDVNVHIEEEENTVVNNFAPLPTMENEMMKIRWVSPNERKFRKDGFPLEGADLKFEIEIESKIELDKDQFRMVVNGNTGGKYGITSLENYSGDGDETHFYTYKNGVKFLDEGFNYVQLECRKEDETIARSEALKVHFEPSKINLYLLAIGTQPVDLTYPTKDADDFANLFEDHPLYKRSSTRKLLGTDATASRIKLELSRLQKNRFITDKDLVIIFMSSHGSVRENGIFSLQGTDYDIVDPDATSVGFNEIKDRLASLPCKKMLFLDACHSGTADPALLQNKKDGRESAARLALQRLLIPQDGWTIITSSGNEPSWEHKDWENGSFTESIISGLSDAKADKDQNGMISIDELYSYLKLAVPQLNASVNYPGQTPKMITTLEGDLEFFKVK